MSHLERVTTFMCWHSGCMKLATERLFNDRSAVIGYYCDKHAKKALEDFRTAEHGLLEVNAQALKAVKAPNLDPAKAAAARQADRDAHPDPFEGLV